MAMKSAYLLEVALESIQCAHFTMDGLKWKTCYKKSRVLASARMPPLVFTIFATNASFLRVIANLQIWFSIKCNIYHVIGHFLPKKHFAQLLPPWLALHTLNKKVSFLVVTWHLKPDRKWLKWYVCVCVRPCSMKREVGRGRGEKSLIHYGKRASKAVKTK